MSVSILLMKPIAHVKTIYFFVDKLALAPRGGGKGKVGLIQ